MHVCIHTHTHARAHPYTQTTVLLYRKTLALCMFSELSWAWNWKDMGCVTEYVLRWLSDLFGYLYVYDLGQVLSCLDFYCSYLFWMNGYGWHFPRKTWRSGTPSGWSCTVLCGCGPINDWSGPGPEAWSVVGKYTRVMCPSGSLLMSQWLGALENNSIIPVCSLCFLLPSPSPIVLNVKSKICNWG